MQNKLFPDARSLTAHGWPERNDLRALIEAGWMTGQLDTAGMTALFRELMQLMAERHAKLCDVETSSLPTEQAERLLDASLYLIGLGMQALSADDAFERLRTTPLRQLLLEGRVALDRKTRAVGRFMHILQTTALPIDHAAYQYATHQAHRAFFSTYDADWGAHELNWTPEYMPALPLRRVKGILYLQAYLEALQTENQILGAVPLTYVQALLKQASVPAETGASPLEALSETLDPGGAVVECNLCALLLDDLMVARGMNAEAILDALRLRGRAAEYVRHYCERGLPRQSQ